MWWLLHLFYKVKPVFEIKQDGRMRKEGCLFLNANLHKLLQYCKHLLQMLSHWMLGNLHYSRAREKKQKLMANHTLWLCWVACSVTRACSNILAQHMAMNMFMYTRRVPGSSTNLTYSVCHLETQKKKGHHQSNHLHPMNAYITWNVCDGSKCPSCGREMWKVTIRGHKYRTACH